MRLVTRLILAACLVSAGGCGGDRGSGTPQQAVEEFIEALETSPAGQGAEPGRARVREWWERLCRTVDPEIRPALRFGDELKGDEGCGAALALTVLYTGDTGRMAQPEKLGGDVLSATVDGESAVVAVRMRYEADADEAAPPPPRSADVRVLAVRRAGEWWLATPKALNPLEASEGAATREELDRQHSELLRE
jgi:hypothetical protein